MEQNEPWIDLGPPAEYVNAIGYMIIQWAYFEAEFDGFITMMMLKPETLTTGKIGRSFNNRAKFFKQASQKCFGQCPVLLTRLENIVDRASIIKQFRDHVAHCRWSMDSRNCIVDTYVQSAHKYVPKPLTLAHFTNNIVKTSAISREIKNIACAGFPNNDYIFPLSVEEQRAMVEFRKIYMPNPPRITVRG